MLTCLPMILISISTSLLSEWESIPQQHPIQLFGGYLRILFAPAIMGPVKQLIHSLTILGEKLECYIVYCQFDVMVKA